jgi:hypothetical protein
MGIKLKNTTSLRKQKSTPEPAKPKNESATTTSQKDDKGWGPIGEVAKKAVEGAAKQIVK